MSKITTTTNMCQCVRQNLSIRVCGECNGLLYSMPSLTAEIERLSAEGAAQEVVRQAHVEEIVGLRSENREAFIAGAKAAFPDWESVDPGGPAEAYTKFVSGTQSDE